MNDNMEKNKVIFEQPLNEKMRTWLRIEYLIKQLEYNAMITNANALLFFHSLSELLEIVERGDIRSDLNKDIEEQKQKLAAWLDVPGVDLLLLGDLLNKLNTVLHQLSTLPKIGQSLKADRLISAVRKRLSIPGGCCSFDLPSFHLWLQQPQDYRDKYVHEWQNSLLTLYQAIAIHMQLIRQSGTFKPITCHNNFYHNCNETSSLLRIRLPVSYQIFPQVSGNASRYVIRFVDLESSATSKIDKSHVEFELATC